MNKTENVQIRMSESTLNQIEKVQEATHAASRSDAVRRAVAIAEILVEAAKGGEKLVLMGKNGRQREIIITGMQR